MSEPEKLITLEEYEENFKNEWERRMKERMLTYPISNIKCRKCDGVYHYISPENLELHAILPESSNPLEAEWKYLICKNCDDNRPILSFSHTEDIYNKKTVYDTAWVGSVII